MAPSRAIGTERTVQLSCFLMLLLAMPSEILPACEGSLAWYAVVSLAWFEMDRPVMPQKLAPHGKAEGTVDITTLKLFESKLSLVDPLPLAAATCMRLCYMSVLPSPRTVPAGPQHTSILLEHLLLHLSSVFLFLCLKVILVQGSESSPSYLRIKANSRRGYW